MVKDRQTYRCTWRKLVGLGMLSWVFMLVGFGQPTLTHVQFKGLKKTSEPFLLRFIESRPGQVFDSLQVAEDITALRNLQLFASLDYELIEKVKEVHLVFQCEEIITVIPFLDFGGVRGNRYVQAGVIDFHFRGKANHLGGFYRYDGRHSYQVFYKNPYVQNSPWGYSVSFLNLATREPLFFEGDRINYLYNNRTLEVLGRYEFEFGHNLQLGGAFLHEIFEQNEEQLNPHVPEEANLQKWILKLDYQYQRLNYYNEFVSGFSQQFMAETVLSGEIYESFWKLLSISRYFQRIGPYGNLGIRFRAGLSPNTGSPFVPFVLDSYVNIRGAGNRVARGSAELVLNFEYRHSLWMRHHQGAVQGVVFTDLGTWQFPGTSLLFSEDWTLFSGVGVRLHLFKAYNFILRADYGFNMRDLNYHGLVLGVGQYF